MYGIITKSKHFVVDNMKDSSGEPRKGVLVYKKKSKALEDAEELNKLRKSIKLTQCYSVEKITPEDVPEIGIIVDGVWKSKL